MRLRLHGLARRAVDVEAARHHRTRSHTLGFGLEAVSGDKGLEALERRHIDAHRGALELREHAQELAPVLLGATGRQRHRHDAAEHAGPEHFDETFVVAEKQDHRVAGHHTPALQGTKCRDRALPKLPEAEHALLVFAVDEGDLAILASVGAEDRIERFETCHGCALGGRATRRQTTPETRTD